VTRAQSSECAPLKCRRPPLGVRNRSFNHRREPIFFDKGDQDIYRDLLAEQMRKAEVEVWAYCLMPNHVHLILCPRHRDGLALVLGAARAAGRPCRRLGMVQRACTPRGRGRKRKNGGGKSAVSGSAV